MTPFVTLISHWHYFGSLWDLNCSFYDHLVSYLFCKGNSLTHFTSRQFLVILKDYFMLDLEMTFFFHCWNVKKIFPDILRCLWPSPSSSRCVPDRFMRRSTYTYRDNIYPDTVCLCSLRYTDMNAEYTVSVRIQHKWNSRWDTVVLCKKFLDFLIILSKSV